VTLVEFIHPARDRAVWEICLVALYYDLRYNSKAGATVEGLRALLKQAHIPKAAKLNIADVLAKSSPYVDISGKQGTRFVWQITETGQKHVRSVLGLPEHDVEVEHDVFTLETLAAGIVDKDVSAYVEESITCLKVGALRAAIVFLWAGATRTIQENCIAVGLGAINAALLKHDKKAREVKSLDDLCYVKEALLLQIAQDIGCYDKNQKGVLIDCLNLRNKSGHPGKYSPGPKKTSSFIEDVVSVVFS
jgi:hypothetical protein